MNPDHSGGLAKRLEGSADSLIAELQAVRDSVEELYLLLDRVWRNREELRSILESAIEDRIEKQGEAVCCVHCDACEDSVAAAVREGWTRLQADGSEGWDFLGVCPGCGRKREEEEWRRGGAVRAGLEMGLTEEQAIQAAQQGDPTGLGLSAVEDNMRERATPEGDIFAQSGPDTPRGAVRGEGEGVGRVERDGPRAPDAVGGGLDDETHEVQGESSLRIAEKETGQRKVLFDTSGEEGETKGNRPRRRRHRKGR